MRSRDYVPEPHEMSDEECSELLMALHSYILYYDHSEDTITSVVTELAQSMDKTTDAEDRARQDIEIHFDSDAVPPQAS